MSGAWSPRVRPQGLSNPMRSPRTVVPPLDFRSTLQPWANLQAPYPPQYASPRMQQSPRELMTRIDDVVSEMERDLFEENFGAKNLLGSLPRIADLERELDRVQDSARRNRELPQRIAELEGQVYELHRNQANHDKECNHYRDRIAEMERDLGTAAAAEEKHKEQYAYQNQRILELESALLHAATKEKQHLHHINDLQHRLAQADAGAKHSELQFVSERQRCEMLEQEFGTLQRQYSDLTKGHEGSCADIVHLSQLLKETEMAHGQLGQQQTKHISRIKQMELVVEECRATEERQRNLVAELRQYIKGLEKELADAPTNDETLKMAHRHTLTELERQIADSRLGEDESKKSERLLQQKLQNMGAEMQELRSRASEQLRSHQEQQKVLRARMGELEKELLDSQSAEGKHREHNKDLQKRQLELEKELDAYTSNKSEAALHSKIVELEIELAGHSQGKSALLELEQRFNALAVELNNEQEGARELRESLLSVQVKMEEVVEDADRAMDRAKEAERAKEADWQLKLEQANARIRELEGKAQKTVSIDSRQRRSTGERSGSMLPEIRAHGAENEIRRSSMPYDAPRMILPNSNHVFVRSVRQTLQEVSETMQKLVTLQVDVIANQLASMAGVQSGFENNSAQRDELVSELHAVDATIDKLSSKLRAQLSEMEVYSDLPAEEKQELTRVLQSEAQICEDEQRLLRESHMGALGDLPRELVDGLLAMHVRGELPGQTLHMAAEYGRRDILEYTLRSSPNARALLNTKDPLDRTPLEIARIFGWPALERWLQDAVLKDAQPQRRSLKVLNTGDTSPFASQMPTSDEFMLSQSSTSSLLPQRTSLTNLHGKTAHSERESLLSLQWNRRSIPGITFLPRSDISRPSLGSFVLPPVFEDLLTRIETSGWESVDWKDDYTMLHWAAGKGQGALCRYLLQLGGDTTVRDIHGRLPADVAKKNGFSDVAVMLSTTM